MTPKTIIVIGGAHGGPTAAARARQFDENARIILVEKAAHVTWVQADLRHHLEGDLTLLLKSLTERDTNFQKRFGVETRTSTEAVAIDADARVVTIKTGEITERIGYDAVVFAGGAVSLPSQIEGLSGPYVCNFRNLDDIRQIKETIAAGAKQAVVLGCGLYGIDAAEGLRAAGLKVQIVEKAPRILPKFSLGLANAMLAQLRDVGTEVFLNETVVAVSKKAGLGFNLQLASKRTLDADLVVVAVGSRPRTELLAMAGAALQRDGSVRVNANMMTTLPSVFACGSAVSVNQVITHERMWLPQPANIERTALAAGQNAASQASNFDAIKAVTGTQIVHIGDRWYARTGLTGGEARQHFGDDRVMTVATHSRSAEIWLEGDEVSVNLLVDKETRSIVGGEVFGRDGVGRQIDLISVAVQEGWSSDKLVDLDLAYIASRAPVLDALKEAGMRAKHLLNKDVSGISSERLALWIAERKKFTLVDVSKQPFEALGKLHAPFVHLPLEDLRKRLDQIDRNAPVVVVSRSGRRAYLALRVMTQRGFSDVYCLDGGSLSWQLLALE